MAGGLLTEFPAGVFWVGLASLRNPALVLESVAQVVGAHGDLASHIGDRELLLLLDNLEQVVEAAPELSALLSACSKLRLLVTSRELLRIQGEVEYAVPPLSDREAVELFCERSRLGPSEEITELCRRLDDLPLAVELAAARTSVLSPAQILERLSQRLDLLKGGRDAEMRQRTLRATIEWSYELLSREEQRLLTQLGVFSGGWSLEAAEAVCGADLDTLQSLVDKNLIRHTGERFWMLETIREYSVDRLEESGEAGKSRAAHAQYYLEVVEDLEPRLRGGEAQEVAFQRLEAELDNLRASLQFGLDDDPDLLVRLVAGSGFFLIVRGHEDEGRRWSALASRTGAGTATPRGKVLRIAGRTAFNVRDLDQARTFFGEALECSRQSGDDQSYVESLRGLGDVTSAEGDNEGARSFYEGARTVSEAAGLDWSVANILASLANLAMTESRWEEGYMLSTEAAERLRASGDWAGATSILADVGLSALRLGRRSEARTALSAVVVSDVADPEAVSYAFDSLAWLLAEGGHAAVSAQVLGASDELFKEVGTTRGGLEQALRDDALLRLRALMRPGELEEAITRGRRLSPEVAARLALAALD